MHEKPDKFRVGLLGGLVIGVVSGIPGLSLINCCCCAGILLGGILTYFLYLQEFTPEMPPPETSDAVVLGVIAGVIGAFLATIIDVVITLLFGNIGAELAISVVNRLIEAVEQSGNVPAGAFDELRDQLESSKEESTTAFGILTGLFMNLILFPIFAILGSLLGTAFFKPKKPIVPASPY